MFLRFSWGLFQSGGYEVLCDFCLGLDIRFANSDYFCETLFLNECY